MASDGKDKAKKGGCGCCGCGGCAGCGCAGAPLFLVFALIFGIIFGIVSCATQPDQYDEGRPCGTAPPVTTFQESPTIDSLWSTEQVTNARTILLTATEVEGITLMDQIIALMTAIGESSLINVDHGDAAGPDSRGLFQQRSSWGPESVRMDPHGASLLFYRALAQVTDRVNMTPTEVAHEVQRNADPDYYTPFFTQALGLVASLLEHGAAIFLGCGTEAGGFNDGGGEEGWVLPTPDVRITSPYGMRINPVTKKSSFHNGVDLAAVGNGAPIYAAHDGVVTRCDFDGLGDGTVAIDHGGGIQTEYLHMYVPCKYVHPGQAVTAGQRIADVGSSGRSTGPHLHYMVIVNGATVDPVPFMGARGLNLGPQI